MTAYYNEYDKNAAQWLRNLIDAGHIAPGYVDERSIEDVYPSDLRGFTQCHFFAGIGVWSYALRNAGWGDDRSVWTGSCPCQPFSAAGKGAGFDDERHLWPAFHHLIKQCAPAIVLGEQVASKAVEPWIDLVHADVEGLGYAFGCVAFPSAGVGAPHIRDRAYWVGHAHGARLEGLARHDGAAGRKGPGRPTSPAGVSGGLANTGGIADRRQAESTDHIGAEANGPANQLGGRGGSSGRLADAERERICTRGSGCADGTPGEVQGVDGQRQRVRPDAGSSHDGVGAGSGPVNGFWRDADWLGCRDAKWRPVEPGTFPLVAGASSRVGRLRGYGNAINAEAAKAFIESVMEAT